MNEVSDTVNALDINQYLKYGYGVTDKELKDLHKFSAVLIDLIEKFLSVKNKDFLKKIISQFNLFPAYGGFAIFEIIHNTNNIILEKFCIDLLRYYIDNKKVEQGSDFIKDLYEIISSFCFFCPDAVIRKILIKDEELIFNYLIDECKNRSALYNAFSCRYADLYLASKKTNEKYILRIIEFFKVLEARVVEANGVIPEIPDAMSVSLKEIKKLTFALKEQENKDGLESLKIILTRKIDLGNLMYYLVIGNESCCGSIFTSGVFSNDIFSKCLTQLKLQQLIEMAIFLENSNAPVQYKTIIDYLEKEYKIQRDAFIYKMREFVTKYESTKFGILIRNPMMMPIEEQAKNAAEAVAEMLSKLSTLANNLTAFISQVSLAISLVLTSKTNLFSIFLKEYEDKKKNNVPGGFASKMQSKDFTKKIKESDVASMNFDQASCRNIICVLIALKEAMPQDFKLAQKEDVTNKAFKILYKKYGVYMTKDVALRFFEIFFSKIPGSIM